MSFLTFTKSTKPLEKKGPSTQKEGFPSVNDAQYSHQSEAEKKKKEQADKQSDAVPRRHDGGDIYRKDYYVKKEKSDSTL